MPPAGENLFQNIEGNVRWGNFVDHFRKAVFKKNGFVSVLQIGDSHIQGGYFTNEVRDCFCQDYGEINRGVIFPYSLAHTNGPEDIAFTSDDIWMSDKYPHAAPANVGISGYYLYAEERNTGFSVSFNKQKGKVYPFNTLWVVTNNKPYEVSVSEKAVYNPPEVDSTITVSKIKFPYALDSLNLMFKCNSGDHQRLAVYMLRLLNESAHFTYDAIGSNGITYRAYFHDLAYQPYIKLLNPDCLVISLGTNDAFRSNFNESEFRHDVQEFVREIYRLLPRVCIILTSPGDHLRGRKYPNPNLAICSRVLHDVAVEQNCVYWDFFKIMGGTGSARKWFARGWMFRDLVHLSKQGYKVQGDLFASAFTRAVSTTIRLKDDGE